MLKQTSILENLKTTNSPLGSTSNLNPKGGKKGINLAPSVNITSLVDAFSILVIYLLLTYSTQTEVMTVAQGVNLPEAAHSATLDPATLIKVQNGKFVIDEKEVANDKLVATLVSTRKALKKKDQKREDFALMIQADKDVPYKTLSEIVLAGNHAGYGEIKFAVMAR